MPNSNTTLPLIGGDFAADEVTINGSLMVNATNYLQFKISSAGAPASASCDSDTERGRMNIDITNNRFYICNGATRGWDYIALTD